ncbi:DNA uptake protein ComE [Pustulibacterium marinum]|uniref:DNA uptake protein ComE n=1 Tax=Pustulibacterium marinum TaxID=1224947 RepID=A0A1I7HQK9_9FLAO|nr:helix-hairpin-helix domain-containing protein [Pustulibacterium marinum]SFU63002.1 DNA uptake protein ComE [Pustulibacterium marinum]
MKNIKSHFSFDRKDRNGIFVLLCVIVIIQVSYFFYKQNISSNSETSIYDEELSMEWQAAIDSANTESKKPKPYIPKPYNPNFISDYKGSRLGMSVEEIDRLHEFRKKDQYVNSAIEFQNVTKISDSLLHAMTPYFKFPEWTQQKKNYNNTYTNFSKKEEEKIEIKDINTATKEDLMAIKGIGEAYSTRILKRKNEINGFLVNDQLYEVWGMDSLVIEKILERFQVLNPPIVEKQNLNTISLKQLQKNPYVNYYDGVAILKYRSKVGNITSFQELEQLTNVKPLTIKRLPLYFYLENE